MQTEITVSPDLVTAHDAPATAVRGRPSRFATAVEIGHRVRAVRERLGLSLRELAADAGVSTMTISRLENGHGSGMALGAFLRLCDGLDMPAEHLLQRWDQV